METKKQCCHKSFATWPAKRCKNTGVLEFGGDHYCKMHHPPTVQEKKRKQAAAFDAKFKADLARKKVAFEEATEQKRRADLYPELLEALKNCVEALAHIESMGMKVNPPTLDSARAAIKKATGG